MFIYAHTVIENGQLAMELQVWENTLKHMLLPATYSLHQRTIRKLDDSIPAEVMDTHTSAKT